MPALASILEPAPETFWEIGLPPWETHCAPIRRTEEFICGLICVIRMEGEPAIREYIMIDVGISV